METDWLIGGIYVSRAKELIMDTAQKYSLPIQEIEKYLNQFSYNRNIDVTLNQDLIVAELAKVLDSLDIYMQVNNRDPKEASSKHVAEFTIKSVYKALKKQGTRISYEAMDTMGYAKEDVLTPNIDTEYLREYAISELKRDPKQVYRRAESANKAIRVLSGEKVTKQDNYKLRTRMQGSLDVPEPAHPAEEPTLFEEDSRRRA